MTTQTYEQVQTVTRSEVTDSNVGLQAPPPTFAHVWAARSVISRHLPVSPFVQHPLLSGRLGFETWVKLENALPLGAFKIRGGINLLASMSPEQRARGLCSATRGNHGQALAWAANAYGSQCTLFVPNGNNPDKTASMEAMGAKVVVSGHTFDAACEAASEFAARRGAKLVHPGTEPALVAGIGTLAVEMLEQSAKPLDVVIVPIGVGSCAAGLGIVFRHLSPQTRIIGVQAASAPAGCRAWHTGRLERMDILPTVADGLAVGVPVPFTQRILRTCLDDVVLVSESEIRAAIRLYLDTMHQLAEGAGAASLAAAVQLAGKLAGRRVALVLSGGNIDGTTLRSVLADAS